VATSQIKCPACGHLQDVAIVCAGCGAPLAVSVDWFAALGLPRRLTISAPALERVYHDLGRKIHPDRFAQSSVALRSASMRATAVLTRAYRVLRDPISRGLYWLELHGHKLSENNQTVPAELAELVFETQEQLAELRAAREHNDREAESIAAEMANRRTELDASIDALHAELGCNFASFDDDDGSKREALFAELKTILSKIAYLRTLLRDVERALETAKAA
jgi:molecular chaperone HscB